MRKYKFGIMVLVFIAAFFAFSFFRVDNAEAANKIEKDFCILCDRSDPERYKMEQQFIDRILDIQEKVGDSINPIVLAATVLHKQNSLEAISERYEENWDEEKYLNDIDVLFNGGESSSEEATDNGDEIGANAGITQGQIDLLDAAALVMKSSANGGKYNEESYKEALVGDTLTPSVDLGSFIFCSDSAIGSVKETIGNAIYSFATNQKVVGGKWQDREKVCSNGYIGGVYNITTDTEPDDDKRQARREAIADEIINLAHYYCDLNGGCEEEEEDKECAVYTGGGGNTQAKDLDYNGSMEKRIEQVGPAAQTAYNATGVWASATIAQLIGESSLGYAYYTSYPDVLPTNNLMGVACGRPNSQCVSTSAGSFSSFSSLEEAFADRANMFDGVSSYGNWRGASTVEEFMRTIGPTYCPPEDCNHADYAQYIINIINQYDLKKWDVKNGSSSSGNVCIDDYRFNGKVTGLMQKVVDEAKRLAGQGYDQLCEGWVERVWAAATGLGRENQESAYSAWKAYGVSTSKDNIPPGAMVYGSGAAYYDDGSNPYGHVGIYVGNGKVADQGGVVDLEQWLSWQVAPCNGHTGWLGWGWYKNTDLSKSGAR